MGIIMEILDEGGIFLQMKNITDQERLFLKLGNVLSAVFATFLIADGDAADGVRTGGFGSTEGTRMKIIFVRWGEPD